MIRTEPIQPMSYRHPRYHNQKTLLEPYQAMALALFVLIPLPLAILFIAGAANSANAMPIWAIQMSRSHCEYLAMGATWDEAATQASRDVLPLYPEAKAAGSLRDRAIHAAIDQRCDDLNRRALSAS